MTSGRTSKLIRKLKDSHWRYWDMVDHEAGVGPVDPIVVHLIQFRNNIATLRLLGHKVDPERWRKYALWYPVETNDRYYEASGRRLKRSSFRPGA